MTILEVLGAFALFFIIICIILTQCGVMQWTVSKTDN